MKCRHAKIDNQLELLTKTRRNGSLRHKQTCDGKKRPRLTWRPTRSLKGFFDAFEGNGDRQRRRSPVIPDRLVGKTALYQFEQKRRVERLAQKRSLSPHWGGIAADTKTNGIALKDGIPRKQR